MNKLEQIIGELDDTYALLETSWLALRHNGSLEVSPIVRTVCVVCFRLDEQIGALKAQLENQGGDDE